MNLNIIMIMDYRVNIIELRELLYFYILITQYLTTWPLPV